MDSNTRINVWLILPPNSLLLDWTGPAEALRMANQSLVEQQQPERFALRFVGPVTTAKTSVGVSVSGLEPLPPLPLPSPSWVMVVGQPGGAIPINTPELAAVTQWLRGLQLSAGHTELLTICAGAVLAAHAGLLHGKRATTHHQHLDALQQVEPACDVVANRVFVEDGALFSSAGVTTGVDLVLHRISTTCGPAIAAQVAHGMVVAMRRGPQDPELSPFLAYRNHMHPALHRVQDAVSQQPQASWNLPRMAQVARTSPRHLTRLFIEHTRVAPLQYLRRIRLAVAQAALQSGRNVTQAAEMAGFSSDTQLRRAWRQLGLSGTPSSGG